jgi:hypothetical protein
MYRAKNKSSFFAIHQAITKFSEFDIEFHIKLIEETIEYVYRYLIEKISLSEYHHLYFKMLHFYHKLNIIIYVNELPEKYYNNYERVNKPDL